MQLHTQLSLVSLAAASLAPALEQVWVNSLAQELELAWELVWANSLELAWELVWANALVQELARTFGPQVLALFLVLSLLWCWTKPGHKCYTDLGMIV